MADKVTFDFEINEIIFDTIAHKGIIASHGLAEKKAEILKAAGYKMTSMDDFRAEINNLFSDLGLDNVECAGTKH